VGSGCLSRSHRKIFARYSLEGFDKFKVVDTELNALLNQSHRSKSKYFTRVKSSSRARAVDSNVGLDCFTSRRTGRGRDDMGSANVALVRCGEAWRSQRERIFTSQLLEGMVSAVAAIDEHDRIRSANAAFFRIFPRATIGASVYEKFASESTAKMLEAATATRVDKAAYRGRWVCPAGEDCEQQQHLM